MPSLYNLEHEKQFLSAAIRNPAILADCSYVNDKDFSETNRIVFNAIQSCLASVGVAGFSAFVLVERLKSLNIRIANAIEPALYINALTLIEINDRAAIEVGRQLKLWSMNREIARMSEQIKDAVAKPGTKGAADLVAEITGIFNAKVNLLGGTDDDEPKDLYGSAHKLLEQQNSYDIRSITPPLRIYQDLWGSFDPGQFYAVVARLKVGKSTFALSVLQQIAMADSAGEFTALYLDTELTTEEVQCRAIASLSGVKEYYIRHKIYRRHKDMREKVEQAIELMRPLWARVDHLYIGGKDLDYQLSAARRWAHKKVKTTGKKGMIVHDYIKTGSARDFRSQQSLSILIGEKADGLKNLSKELELPILGFVQANRENEDSKAGGRIQNSSVVAGSDMIAQFATNVHLLERLTPEQRTFLGQLTPDSATHSLKIIAPRQLGPNELGLDRLVKYQEMQHNRQMVDRHCENYLLMSFHNFVVSERGTFYDAIERNKITGVNVQPAAAPTPEDQKML